MRRRLAPLDSLFALVVGGVIIAALPGGAHALPTGYDRFTSDVTVWQSGNTMVVQVSAVPNHKSPYFYPNDPRYEAYNGSNPNYQQNPNHISTQTIEFHLPANPTVATNHQATPLGPIGVALNGVPFFNQYAGPNQPLTNEINSFDQYNGHPQQTGMYHYHVAPAYLTGQYGEDALVGFLLDGFPVYGPMENGVPVTNSDLDQYHGHFHATADYPGGIYHYHITAAAPYINGAGFYGEPGAVTYSFSPTPTAQPVGGSTELAAPAGDPSQARARSGGSDARWIALAASAGVLAIGGAGWLLMRSRRRGGR